MKRFIIYTITLIVSNFFAIAQEPEGAPREKSDYALAQEAYESKNLEAIKGICEHPGKRGNLIVYLDGVPSSAWKDEVVLVVIEAPWPGDRVEGRPAPPGSPAPFRYFQLAVDLLAPALPDENLKMNDRDTYAKLSTLNGRKRLAEKFREAAQKNESPDEGKQDEIGDIPNEDLSKSTKLGTAEQKSLQPDRHRPEIPPQPNKSWIWILVAFIVLAGAFVIRRMGSRNN
jgi:hypothetical protein